MLKVKRINLILFTGFIWLWAGFLLLHRSWTWIHLFTNNQLHISIIIAIVIGAIKTYLIFHKLTTKNIKRIMSFKDKFVSIFKFHKVKDQVLIIVMIVGGSLLRNTPSVPKIILMPIYIGIGLAMLYSSSLYFLFFKNNKKVDK